MAIGTLTWEKVQEFCAEKEELENEMEELRGSSPSSLWNKDLDALEKELDELERQDAEAEVTRNKIKEKACNVGAAVAKQAPKKPRKNNTKPSPATGPIAIDCETVQEVTKLKPRGRQNKSTKAVSVESDEDEELVALKERLAAYNLNSSPKQSAMETEIVPEAAAAKEGPKKRGAAAKKAFTVVSDEDSDDDEDFEKNAKAPKGKKGAGGRKPANATSLQKPKLQLQRRKERHRANPVLNQKLISELLPPATNAISSPEKKMRKIRPYPFNKKSGSFLNKFGINGSSSGDSSSGASGEAPLEDYVARARPKRENRTRVVYVESESEAEEEDEVFSEYSNFELEDEY